MKNPVVFGDYQGIKVSVNEWGSFDAKIDGADIVADTYRALKEKIDQTLKNKQKAKKKVSIKVVNEDLKTATVTGVHTRLGTLTMTPKLEHRDVWLDCEPVKKLLTEMRAAKQRIEKIEDELKAFEIKARRKAHANGFGELREDEYDHLLADLDKYVAVATKAANSKAVKHGA